VTYANARLLFASASCARAQNAPLAPFPEFVVGDVSFRPLA